jgi:hypothetical protein
MFKVGDEVVVVNNGQTYNNYKILAATLNATSWVSGHLPQNNVKAKIVALQKFRHMDPIALIEIPKGAEDEGQYLVGIKGLKHINDSQCISLWEIE